MSLNHTILGFLGWKPLSGYELKKLFIDTDFIYWSGNNNQIYRTLVQLSKDGFVTKKIIQQENLPAKKVYHITERGRQELNEWAASKPEATQVRNTFLMQLGWSGGLSGDRLMNIVDEYLHDMDMRLAMCRAKLERKTLLPSRTEREKYIWEMLWQREIEWLQGEINWLSRLRNGLQNRNGQ